MAKISVVIPAYNREKTIEYCLESIFNQSLKPYEIIVVDDCSTDKTVEIINKMNHPLIKIVRLYRNGGAQAARNRGIKEAFGEWIAFQDSDDEWLPEKLERQIEKAIKGNYDVVYCECFVQQGSLKEKYNTPNFEKDTYKNLLISPGPTFPGIFAKKYCFEEIGLLDEKVPSFQEWDTSIQLAKYYPFGFIPEPLYIYHLHDGVTISKDKTIDALGVEYIVNKYKTNIISIAGKSIFINQIENVAQRFLIAGNYKKWKEYKIKQLKEQLPNVKLYMIKKFLILNFPRLYNTIKIKYVNFKENY